MNGVPQRLRRAQIDYIVDQIQNGQCVPFLGAAANVSSAQMNYDGLPIGAQLARLMFDELDYRSEKLEKIERLLADLNIESGHIGQLFNQFFGEEGQGLTDREMLERCLASLGLCYSSELNLPRLSQELEDITGRPQLHRFIKREIPDEERNPSPLLTTLAKLPFKLIVTTNYDRLMEKALKQAGKVDGDYRVVVQEFDPKELVLFHQRVSSEIDGFGGLILYKIHGSFPPERPGIPEQEWEEGDGRGRKILITEDDYVEFLTFITHGDKGIPNKIKASLITSTVLFFGYSLEDWDFRVLYKSLIEPLSEDRQEKPYAFQKNPNPAWVGFWSKKNLDIFDMDHYVFAEQLEEACKRRGLL
jgi:hypothetical protein